VNRLLEYKLFKDIKICYMNHTINVTWENNMKFTTKIGDHNLILDASEDNGGNNEGPRPKSLMMVALAGCTGMDVVSILKKMQVEISYFNLRVEGVTADDHPKKFSSMKVIYEFKGNDLSFSKIEKAVKLSIDKYCGVNANYKETMKMDYEIIILD
jgi:putative redox protein